MKSILNFDKPGLIVNYSKMLPDTNACIFCMNSVHLVNKNAKTRRDLKHVKINSFGSVLLDNEVNVMFIVRKLLSIPQQQCTELLEQFGNPSSWFVTCGKCAETVNDAKEIHKKIMFLEKTLDKRRKEVTKKIIESAENKRSLKTRRHNEMSQDNSTTTLIRNTVLSNELIIGREDVEDIEIKYETTDYNSSLENDDSIQDDFCSSDDGIRMEAKPTEMEPHNIACSGATNTGHNKPAFLLKRPTEVRKKRSRKLGRSASNEPNSIKFGSYKCSHCSCVFKLPGQLRAHLKRIHWVITYQADRHCSDRKCLSCHKLFHDLDTFRKHCIEDHSMVSCNLCPRVFPSYRNLQKHQSVTHGNSKQINTVPKVKIDKASGTSKVEESAVYKCPYCNFYSIKQCKTSLHIREIHWELYAQLKNKRSNRSESTSNQKTLQCDRCPISGDGSETNQFSSLEDLNQHKVTAHKMVQCKQCSKVLLGMGYLENHQKKYHSTEKADSSKLIAETAKAESKLSKISKEKKQPICKHCQATFETKAQLTQHHFDTHPNEMYKCEKCPEKFETMANLYFHRTAVHGEPDNPYKCPLCNYSNRRFRLVHLHRRKIHEERTRFVCETCGDSFADARYLEYHNICKHGAKSDINLNCAACGKRFTSPIYLKRHYNTVHLGQWRYKCPQCDVGFMSQKQVDQHVNSVHKKILPHGCTVEGCEKKYGTKYQLKEHTRRVHGPKCFKCSYCDYATACARQLKAHEEEKHVKGGSFQCDFCGKSYTIQRCLKQHLRMTHKIRIGRGKRVKLTDFVAQTMAAANSTTQHDIIVPIPTIPTSNVNDIKCKTVSL